MTCKKKVCVKAEGNVLDYNLPRRFFEEEDLAALASLLALATLSVLFSLLSVAASWLVDDSNWFWTLLASPLTELVAEFVLEVEVEAFFESGADWTSFKVGQADESDTTV